MIVHHHHYHLNHHHHHRRRHHLMYRLNGIKNKCHIFFIDEQQSDKPFDLSLEPKQPPDSLPLPISIPDVPPCDICCCCCFL